MSSPDWYAETLRLSGQVVRVNAEHRALREIHALLEADYHELLSQVGKKFDGETRHQTALRYLREHEDVCGQSGDAKEAKP